jgi:hypothetical protein
MEALRPSPTVAVQGAAYVVYTRFLQDNKSFDLSYPI